MAVQTKRSLLNYLGFVIYGDIADLTMYRSQRGKLVVFQKTWPDKPPSYYQLIDRTRFAAAAHAWNDLTAAQKRQWNLAARRASLTATGYNLWIYCWIAPDNSCLTTIARQTRCSLDCPCHHAYS